MQLTHLGGPTVLVELDGWRILTDPTFDPPGRRYAFGWGTSSTKTAGPAQRAGALGPVDAVLLSHDHHADNLDDLGRALLPGVGTVVTTRPGSSRLRAANVRGLSAGELHPADRAGQADARGHGHSLPPRSTAEPTHRRRGHRVRVSRPAVTRGSACG